VRLAKRTVDLDQGSASPILRIPHAKASPSPEGGDLPLCAQSSNGTGAMVGGGRMRHVTPVGREKECLSALKSVVANVGPPVCVLDDAAAVFGVMVFGWFGARQQTAQIVN